MIKLTEENTRGKIASFIKTYKLGMEYGGYNDYIIWYKWFRENIDSNKTILSLDIETKKLYPIDNELLMFAFAYKDGNSIKSVAFSTRDWSKNQIVNVMKSINLLKSKIVLHNAYFDITTLAIMFGINIKWAYDTYLIFHNCLPHRAKEGKDNDFGQENTGLSLKDLTRDFLHYGDYEDELVEYKRDYCRENKLKVSEFTYDLIPDSILAPYNCMDVICTLELYYKGLELIKMLQGTGFSKLREIIKMKHDVTNIYIEARNRGILVDRNKVLELNESFKQTMKESEENIHKDLKKHIDYVERELYFMALEKELMKDFEYIAENRPKVSKTGKEKWVSKQVKITDLRAKRIKEQSKINLNSSKHKAMLFVDSMGLEPLERSKKTNEPKCDIKFLEYHLRLHPELQSFLDFGKCRTALNNFLGVEKAEEVGELDELGKNESKTIWELTSDNYPYIHSNYNLNGTVTSRCSCSTINLQQIPSRGVLKNIKKCFVARPNHYFIYSDYSSAEVVILASIINSKTIHQSLINKWDLHSMNAWKMLKGEILEKHPEFEKRFEECGDDVDKLRDFYADIKAEFEQTARYKTKSLVFSLAYGTTSHGVSKALGISKKEAQELIDKYLDANPEMREYILHQHTQAKKFGFTENPFGARLLLPDTHLMSNTSDRHVKMRGEKQLKKSLNVPIQSSNAFLLYEGLIRANKLIKERGYEGKIHFVFSVYDSFCYEIHDSVPKEDALDILERAFVCNLGDFYLGIDSEIGLSWGNTESLKRDRRSKEDITQYTMKMY